MPLVRDDDQGILHVCTVMLGRQQDEFPVFPLFRNNIQNSQDPVKEHFLTLVADLQMGVMAGKAGRRGRGWMRQSAAMWYPAGKILCGLQSNRQQLQACS